MTKIRRKISIDEKIQKQEEFVEKIKEKLQLEEEKLKDLKAKKDDVKKQELLVAISNSGKSIDEILEFVTKA